MTLTTMISPGWPRVKILNSGAELSPWERV